MEVETIWTEVRYSIFLAVAFITCVLGFYIGTVELPFIELITSTINVPLFAISIGMVVLYTFSYNIYYRESGLVTFILSFLFIGYPVVEFRYGIILLTLQSSLVLLAYGIGLNLGAGVTVGLDYYDKSEKMRSYLDCKFRNMFKGRR